MSRKKAGPSVAIDSDKGPGWALSNVEELAKKHPATFQIPTEAERTSLEIGAVVKLAFEAEGGGASERMWVAVRSRVRGSVNGRTFLRYVGTLQNRPALIAGLKQGAAIDFGPEHVAATS